MVVNGLGLRVEEGVQQRDYAIARKSVGARGEATQIGGPQHGADLFTGAAVDLALQHLWARIGAQIGIEHISGDGSLTVHIDQNGQALRYERQIGDF